MARPHPKVLADEGEPKIALSLGVELEFLPLPKRQNYVILGINV
jgi:hypothetical protein